MQEKRSSKTIVVVAGVGTVALVGAWLGMRLLAADPPGASDATTPPENAAVAVPARTYDKDRVENLRRLAKERSEARKRLEIPEHLKPKAELVPPGPDTRWDAWLVSTIGKAAGNTAKQEDVLGKEQPRVDLHGEGRIWRRAEVDLDRDGKWDEQWELVNGQLRRRVSPADDGNYTREAVFTSGVWTVPPGTKLEDLKKKP